MKNSVVKFLYNFLINKKRKQLTKYGRFLGRLFYYLNPRWRTNVKKNLEILNSDSGKKSVKNVFENNFTSFVDIFFIPKIDEHFLINCVDVINEQKVRDFASTNKRYAIVSAPIGCWELAPTLFAKVFKTRVVTIGQTAKSQKINDIIVSLRKNQNVDYLQNINFFADIYNYLDNNVPVWLLLDQSAKRNNSLFIDFFGLRTFFNAAIATICIRKDIPALPCFCIRENENVKLLNYSPIFPDKKIDPKNRIRQFAREINAAYEDVIKQYPDQCLHLYKQFKRTESKNDTKTDSIS